MNKYVATIRRADGVEEIILSAETMQAAIAESFEILKSRDQAIGFSVARFQIDNVTAE